MMSALSKASSAAPLCDKSIIEFSHQRHQKRLENDQEVILERLSYQSPIHDRRLLCFSPLQVSEVVQHKSRYRVSNDDGVHEKLSTAITILKGKKSLLRKIGNARSTAAKRVYLRSDQDVLLRRKKKFRVLNTSRSCLVLKGDQVAKERCAVTYLFSVSNILYYPAMNSHSTLFVNGLAIHLLEPCLM